MDSVVGIVFALGFEGIDVVDWAGDGAFVAGERAAVVASNEVAFVEASDGEGFHFGDPDGIRFVYFLVSHFVCVDVTILKDAEEIGREIAIEFKVLVSDLNGFFGFIDRIKHQDLVPGFCDYVASISIQVVKKLLDWLTETQIGLQKHTAYTLLRLWFPGNLLGRQLDHLREILQGKTIIIYL